MRTTRLPAVALLVLVLASALAWQSTRLRGAAPLANRAAQPIKITLAGVAGKVEVSANDTQAWQPATEGATLAAEDRVKTGEDGYAMIEYADATLRLVPSSLAVLGFSSIRVQQGSTWMRMRKSGRTFTIDTQTVAVSVVGTLVRAEAIRGAEAVQLIEGAVNVRDIRPGGKTEHLGPLTQAQVVRAGGLLVSKLDPASLQRLAGEYQNVMKVLPPSGSGKSGQGKGNKGGSGSGGAGSSGDAGGDAGGGAAMGFGGYHEQGGSAPASPEGSSSGGTKGASSSGVRSSLTILEGLTDSRSTGLAAPSTLGADDSAIPNSGAQPVTVQSEPGGAAAHATANLNVPVPVNGGAVAGGGAPPAPPPR